MNYSQSIGTVRLQCRAISHRRTRWSLLSTPPNTPNQTLNTDRHSRDHFLTYTTARPIPRTRPLSSPLTKLCMLYDTQTRR